MFLDEFNLSINSTTNSVVEYIDNLTLEIKSRKIWNIAKKELSEKELDVCSLIRKGAYLTEIDSLLGICNPSQTLFILRRIVNVLSFKVFLFEHKEELRREFKKLSKEERRILKALEHRLPLRRCIVLSGHSQKKFRKYRTSAYYNINRDKGSMLFEYKKRLLKFRSHVGSRNK